MGYNTPNLQKRWESNLGQLGEKREPYSALNNFFKFSVKQSNWSFCYFDGVMIQIDAK